MKGIIRTGMRLDKLLADMGLGTRSDIKKNIRKGKAAVNGSIIKDPGMPVTESMDIRYFDRPVYHEEYSYYMLNKPAGYISATKDENSGQMTVIDLLDEEQKRTDLFPAGRLDKDTEGLLLITNDGQLAHRLLSPKRHVDKVYYACVFGEVTRTDIERFRNGITITEDFTCLPADLRILNVKKYDNNADLTDLTIKTGSNSTVKIDISGFRPENAPLYVSEVEIVIREGKFHQIKRMFHAVGKEVLYLKRLSMGPLVLDPSLRSGKYRRLTEKELADLNK